MFKAWMNLQKYIDLKSGAILTIWTMAMLSFGAIVVLAKVRGKVDADIPSGVVTTYGLILTAYAASKTTQMYIQGDKK